MKCGLSRLKRGFVSVLSGEKTRGFLQLKPSGNLIKGLQKAGHLAFTAGPRAIPNARQAVCKVPQESLTVICVQVEQILKLIKLQPHDENAKTNLAFGSGRIKNRWLTISQGSSQIPKASWCRNAKSVTANSSNVSR